VSVGKFSGRRGQSGSAPIVGLFGILGAGNIGNDAQMEPMLTYLRQEHPGAVVDAMTTGSDRLRDVYGVHAVPLNFQFKRDAGKWEGRTNQGTAATAKRPGPAKLGRIGLGLIIDAYRTASWVRRHDVVIVPGAGVLESSLLLRPWGMPYAMFLLCLSGKVFRTKVALVCVGANVINQRLPRFLCVSAAKLASYRSYRDEFSREAMGRQGVDTSADAVYADLAFGIPSLPDEPGDAGTIGVGIMAYYGANDDREQAKALHEAYVEKIKLLLRRLVDSGRRVRLFVGDSNGSDASVAAELLADLRTYRPDLDQTWFAVEETESFGELMKAMSAVGAVIAVRYHNVLCTLKLGKPTVALAYSGKHDALMRDMGMAEYCQPIKSFDVDLLLKQLDHMAERPVELRKRMKERHAVKAELLRGQFTQLSGVFFPASDTGQAEGNAWGVGAKSGSNGDLEYYKEDYWREENLKFRRPHHRLEKSARIIGRLSQGRKCELLDVGCGPAALKCLLPPNVNYYGIDIAIREPAPNLMEADILQTPIGFGDKKFDMVSAQGVFEYLGDHQLEKFSEIANILKSDGKFLVSYWNFGHRRPLVYDSFSHVQPLAGFRRTLEQYFSVDRSFPVAHNWEQSSPSRPFVRAINMSVNVHIPVISPRLAVEYFFLCSRRPGRTRP
jgi:polysaccharide pyruvyl transferase WcaK-like protein/SAM-dependent methyltransferase